MLKFMREQAPKILLITIILFFLSIVIVEFQGSRRGGAARKAQQALKIKGELATINGKDINTKYFIKRYNTMVMNYKSPLQKDPLDPKLNEQIQYYALQKTFEFEKYLTLAKKYKIKTSNKEVKSQVEAIKKYYNLKSTGELKDLLAKNGYRYKDFLTELREEILVAKLLDSVKKSINVTSEDVKNQYKKIQARHILISTLSKGEAKAESFDKAARKKIADIYSQLVKGADFAELAKKYSEDPGSAAKGGDLGIFGTGVMVPEFEAQVLSLQPGQYSKPFKTMFGYHIVKLEKIESPGIPIDIDEKEEIKKITERKTQEALMRLDQEANASLETEIFMPTLLAYDYKAKGEFDKALGTYQLLASQSPQSPIPHIFTAEIYELQKNQPAALAEYQRALLKEKMFPGSKTPFVHYYLGKFYAKTKQNTAAAQEFKTADELTKDNLWLLSEIKKAYDDLGYKTQAGKIQLKIKALETAWKMAQEKAQGNFELEESAKPAPKKQENKKVPVQQNNVTGSTELDL